MYKGGRFSVAALLGVATLGAALLGSTPVNAVTVQVNSTFPGNDCAGVFGGSFAECEIPSDIDPDTSPIIIKFNFEVGEPPVEINVGLFPSIDGSEFILVFPPPGDGSTGSWTYIPGAGDPGVTFWAAKGGPSFNLFTDSTGDPVLSGTWFTPLVGQQQNPSALSHISFYDTGGAPPQEMPEPASLLLVGAALAALGIMRRRRR